MSALVQALSKDTPTSLQTAVEAAGLVFPDVNALEVKKLTMGIVPTQAVFVLAAQQARRLTKLADASAALAMETIGAFTEPFQQAHHDVARPYASAVDVASTLRWLLDSSALVNKAKRKVADPACFRDVPLVHAAMRDAATVAATVARADLNSAEAAGHANDWQHDASLTPALIQQSAATLLSAAKHSLATVCARVRFVVEHMAEFGPLCPAQADSDAGVALVKAQLDSLAPADVETAGPTALASALLSTVRQLRAALLLETAVCGQTLYSRSIVAAEAAEKAQQAKKVALEERIAKLEAEGNTAQADKLRLSQQAKPKAKDNKDAKKSGLCLGSGTTILAQLVPSAPAKAFAAVLDDMVAASAAPLFWDEVTRSVTAVNQTVMPKLPKGTRDSSPQLMAVREHAFKIITDIFQRHGAVGIDTPVFERKETLTGKYGEDSKLIYDLADQGGEILALRYDLTVPFARYCATNGVTNIKRYHIAKVYRRDNPVMNKGRFREFFQCDYDIAGVYPPMIADAEVIKTLSEILSALDIGSFTIKLNHRQLLDAVMTIAGVPADSLRPICSAVDKLDKEPWAAVREEMVVEKGLPEAVADRLEKYVTMPVESDPMVLLEKLRKDTELSANAQAQRAFADLSVLFGYLKAMSAIVHVSFDMSLARGLDYYTGLIYEAVLTDPTAGLGSVAAGGRYDGLVGMFAGKAVPAVGVSVGIERILALLEKRMLARGAVRATKTSVLVACVGADLLEERMRVCTELWERGIAAEFVYHENPNIRKQMEYAFDSSIPFIAWLGEDEVRDGVVRVKPLTENKDEQVEAVVVKRADLAAYITEALKSEKPIPSTPEE
jgi:histidyl-tRNA synthetase